MELYSSNDSYKLYKGDMRNMLDVIKKESIDAVLTDPPYELNFMNKGWDNSGIAFQKETWQKCYEVLKPGGYLLAFGGSRTFHRIACAIEDAGFEIRDTIMWLYGSGFPKSLNIGLALDKKNGIESKIIGTNGTMQDLKKVGKITGHKMTFGQEGTENCERTENYIYEAQNEWKGWGTALKPSFEPIIVARKPFKGSLVDNVIEYGVGGINIDECRVPHNEKCKIMKKQNEINSIIQQSGRYDDTLELKPNGRFPANTILTYDETDFDEVCGGFPNTKGDSPNRKSRIGTGVPNFIYEENKKLGKENKKDGIVFHNYTDSGSASRYFYCAKASKKDRDEGLDEFEEVDTTKLLNRKANTAGVLWEQGGTNAFSGAGGIKKNTHPTVKPTELMQYLIRLVSPNGATILDPFNGSGSTGKAVMYENKERNKNYKYIGIELTEEYLPISKARIEYVCKLNKEELKEMQLSIFDL